MRIPSLMIWGDLCLSKTVLPGRKRCCTSGQIPAAPAVVLAVPSPPGVAEHPFSSLQETGASSGAWHTSPLCVPYECSACKAEYNNSNVGLHTPSMRWERSAKGEEGSGKKWLCLRSWVRVFSLWSSLFLGSVLCHCLLCCELSCCLLLLPFTTDIKDAVLTSSCFGFAAGLLIMLSEAS